MLFQFLDAIRTRDLVTAVAVLLGFLTIVAAITFHEFAHAYTADRLGDPTPRYQRRLTLNPLAHLDPIGTLLIVIAGFGFGRPVQFNPALLRTDRRLGTMMVALAGPLTNIFLGVVFGLSLRLVLATVSSGETNSAALRVALETMAIFVELNFILAIFNMIPFPPLDGSKVLPALLPPEMAYSLERFYFQTQQYGFFVVLLIMSFAGRFIGPLISGPAQALFQLVVGIPF